MGGAAWGCDSGAMGDHAETGEVRSIEVLYILDADLQGHRRWT